MVNLHTRCDHHKDNSLLAGGISCSSFCLGWFTISGEVNIICVVMKHMTNGNEHLSCHGHQYLHFVLSPDLRLMVREPAEEAVICPAGCPCALNDGLVEIYISVYDAP